MKKHVAEKAALRKQAAVNTALAAVSNHLKRQLTAGNAAVAEEKAALKLSAEQEQVKLLNLQNVELQELTMMTYSYKKKVKKEKKGKKKQVKKEQLEKEQQRKELKKAEKKKKEGTERRNMFPFFLFKRSSPLTSLLPLNHPLILTPSSTRSP
ncbi:uncharacterized protein [Paralichthys olivaceus]|uniref:uncharacterized protein n=1 Tax=Paralichthys olivaceus TaxID=8255 RepID=UPI0037511C2D